jgi:hypothetical protein
MCSVDAVVVEGNHWTVVVVVVSLSSSIAVIERSARSDSRTQSLSVLKCYRRGSFNSDGTTAAGAAICNDNNIVHCGL